MSFRVYCVGVAMLAAVAIASIDGVTIAWKPKLGDTHKYKLNAKATMEGPAGAAEMNFGATVTSKIAEIKADGNIVVEETQSEISIKFGDQDFSSSAPQSVKSTTTMNPRGEPLMRKSDSETENPRLEAALELVYPEKAVNVGDAYTVKRPADSAKGLFARETTYTYEGTEKFGKWDCYKIKMAYKETDAPTNMTTDGFVWVSIEDGSLVKGVYTIKNVEFAPGLPPTASTAEIVRVD